jgi:hypothetical protein
MVYLSKSELALNQKIIKMEKSNLPTLYGENSTVILNEKIKKLNSKILTITLIILDEFPELSEFLSEMPVTIPNQEKPNINVKMLNCYYESLLVLKKQYLKQR